MICIHHAEWESGAAEHGAQEETIPALRGEGVNGGTEPVVCTVTHGMEF